jgi:eukaryotic-like serine/threonine-protein kinase
VLFNFEEKSMQSISFGNYELHEQINIGKRAEVYRATRTDFEGVDRLVAIKRLLPEYVDDDKAVSLLFNEAKIAMQLTHGNVAQVLDSGEIDGIPYIATEYIDGKALSGLCDRVVALGQRLPVPFTCHTIIKLCEALTYIHEKKSPSGAPLALVHGNISPRNILISYDGEVKIIDFSIARSAGKIDDTSVIFEAAAGYMSPEQVKKMDVDCRSDIFNVGICLYEMVAGERLFSDATDVLSLQKIRDAAIPQINTINPLVPYELQKIILKALARERENRYQTASELHDNLQAFMYSNGYLYSRKEMSAYLRELFSDDIDREYLSSDPTKVSDGQVARQDTGLIAFEDLEPISTVSALIATEEVSAGFESRGADPFSKDQEVTPIPPEYSASSFSKDQEEPPIPIDFSDVSSSLDNEAASASAPVPMPAQVPPVRAPISAPALYSSGGGGYQTTLVGIPTVQKRSLPPLENGAPSPWSLQFGSESSPNLASPSRPSFNPFNPLGVSDSDSPFSTPSAPVAPRTVSRPPSAPAVGSVPPPTSIKTTASIPPTIASHNMDSEADDEATRVYDASVRYSLPPSSNRSAPGLLGESPVAPNVGQIKPMQPVREGLEDVESNKKPLKLVLTSVAVALVLGIGGYFILKKPAPGVINLSTNPESVTIKLDGLMVSEGVGPFVISGVEPNSSHQIEVSKNGYRSWSTTVEVKPNQTLNIPEVVLESEKTETGFAIDSLPTAADVFLDGKKLPQTTPVRIADIGPGMHTIRIEKGDAYRPWETQIQIPNNQILDLSRIVLEQNAEKEVAAVNEPAVEKSEKKTHRESAKAPKAAKAEKKVKVAAVKAPKKASSAPPAVAAVPVVAPQAVAPMPAQPKTMDKVGTLRVNTRPWSQVLVDDRFIGNTPQMNIVLPAGKHKVTFISPTFNIKKDITVRIGTGKTVTKVVTLVPGG